MDTQLWDINITILQKFQNKVLCAIVDAPYYVCNEAILHDIPLKSIKEVIHHVLIYTFVMVNTLKE